MKLAGLSLEQAPPFSVPMLFFLTAPVFGIIASIILLTEGQSIMYGRWLPSVLSLSHALLLGFAVSVMFGAMQQMLPVVAGSPIDLPQIVSPTIQLPWVMGILSLIGGFLTNNQTLHLCAIIFLTAATFIFIFVAGRSLKKAQSDNETVQAMRYSLFSFVVVIILGLILASGHAKLLPFQRGDMTDLHLSWGLLGWMGFLIMGVAYQVVPMFQITPTYAPFIRKYLVPSMFALICTHSFLLIGPSSSAFIKYSKLAVMGLMALGLCTFAVYTLFLQAQRRRKIWDATLWFWRFGMLCLLAAVGLWIASNFSPSLKESTQFHLALGALYILGFVFSIIIGMLYKIVPFLVWFHLQGEQTSRMMEGLPLITVPHMKAVISDRRATIVLIVHTLAVLSLIASLFFKAWIIYMAGSLLLLSFLLLGIDTLLAARLYKRISTSSPAESQEG